MTSRNWLVIHVLVSVINSFAPGRFQRSFRKVIFQLILVIDGWSISCKILLKSETTIESQLKWMTMDLTDGKSTLVQVMAWCRQATSHYLSQCWHPDLCHHMASLGHNELNGGGGGGGGGGGQARRFDAQNAILVRQALPISLMHRKK